MEHASLVGARLALLGWVLFLVPIPLLIIRPGWSIGNTLIAWTMSWVAGLVLILLGIAKMGALGRATPPPLRDRPGFKLSVVGTFFIALGLVWFAAGVPPVLDCAEICPGQGTTESGMPQTCLPPCENAGPAPPPIIGSFVMDALGAVLLGIASLRAKRSASEGTGLLPVAMKGSG